MPDAFAFDVGIQAEERLAGARQAEVDEVAVRIGREAEAEPDRTLSGGSLHGVVTPLHGGCRHLGARPEGGGKAALAGEGLNHIALRGVGEQAHGAIEIRLAAAVSAGDKVEAAERQDQVAEGAVAGDGEGGQHRA
ncbi:MAG: hypothetical protein SFV54_23070 [Bryobacteraceae bacterium]|nr:hypothetical protein [Bryobacteraceae bacterium]